MRLPVVVPAAGEGTRMETLTADRPKPLVEVAGKPLLQHVLSAFPPDLVSTFVVVTGEDGGPIEERFGASFEGTPIEYVTQATPSGLGDAVSRAKPAVAGTFVVMNGDNLVRGDLSGLVETHRERGRRNASRRGDLPRNGPERRRLCLRRRSHPHGICREARRPTLHRRERRSLRLRAGRVPRHGTLHTLGTGGAGTDRRRRPASRGRAPGRNGASRRKQSERQRPGGRPCGRSAPEEVVTGRCVFLPTSIGDEDRDWIDRTLLYVRTRIESRRLKPRGCPSRSPRLEFSNEYGR